MCMCVCVCGGGGGGGVIVHLPQFGSVPIWFVVTRPAVNIAMNKTDI